MIDLFFVGVCGGRGGDNNIFILTDDYAQQVRDVVPMTA